MSEADSFIDEVNDEVRREKLYRTFRKYGWIGVVAVVLIVGGASFNEYRKAQESAAAQALGDEIINALAAPEPVGKLDQIAAKGDVTGVIALLTAAEDMSAKDPAAAVEILMPLAARADIPVVYSDLAAFKMVMIGGDAVDADMRSQLLRRLAAPGAPFRPLALEQEAVDLAAAGDTEAAIAAGRALLEEAQLTPALARRVTQLLVALGAGNEDAEG